MKNAALKTILIQIGAKGVLRSTPFYYVRAFYADDEMLTFVVITNTLGKAKKLAKSYSKKMMFGRMAASSFNFYRNSYIANAALLVEMNHYINDNS